MRKKYQKLKLKLSALFLVLLILGSAVITYQKADTIADEYTEYALDMMQFGESSLLFNKWGDYHSFDEDGNIIFDENNGSDIDIGDVYTHYSEINLVDNMGFYSLIMNSQGIVLGEFQNFLTIYNQEGEERFLLLGDAHLSYEELSNIEISANALDDFFIKGTCDTTFVYPEEIKWKQPDAKDYSLYKPQDNKTELGTVDFNEWAGENYSISLHFGAYYYDDKEENIELKNEAEEYCRSMSGEYLGNARYEMSGSTFGNVTQGNLFTKYIATMGYFNEKLIVPHVCVVHPLKIAVEQLINVYGVMLVFAIISITAVCELIEKTYKQELENETNRRELTRGIAHELKTPLAITKGYIENWQYLGDKEKNETKETIIDEIDHMNRLITDLLELSHLEAKNKEIHWEDVDILALTKSIIHRLNPIIEERKLDVTIVLDGSENTERYIVEADLEMIRTAIVNYISNAVKYADKEITIKLSEKSRTVAFVIENDGVIIDKKKISRIWDDFYKDSEYNRSSIGSSGLGLAITKNIFILHKAKYGCDSDSGKNRFMFELSKKRNI